MCGISALISKKGIQVDPGLVAKFNNAVAHRGPDDEGYFSEKGLALGHRRLSIIDLSKDGHQPMPYLDRYTIVYNGEIYNYIELRDELQKLGYQFKSQTDTEAIMASFHHWGSECVHRFNGMWAFIIYDRDKQQLFCSRDRFGIKPLHYSQVGDYFAIASEVKQFTTLPAWESVANRSTITDFIVFGAMDHTDETLFADVMQLQAGHNLIYDLRDNTYEIEKWYTLNITDCDRQITSADYIEEFRHILSSSISLRLRSDVDVGSCLSGGLDSSSIVCLLNGLLTPQANGMKQQTVSACYNDFQFDESEYIDTVVTQCNIEAHKVFPQWDNFQEEMKDITWHQDTPLVSSSQYAQWCVFREAKNHNLTVMLDGQGADEILCGYMGFFQPYYSSLLRSLELTKLMGEIRGYSRVRQLSTRQISKWLLFSLRSSQVTRAMNYYHKTTLPGYNGTIDSIRVKQDTENLKSYSKSLIEHHMLPMLLHFEDRNSMAFSVESRVPFLDYRLVELLMNIPDHLKINKGVTKYVLREAMKEILPKQIYNRHDKLGFTTPEGLWLDQNKSFVIDELIKGHDFISEFVDMKKVKESYMQEMAGQIQLGSYYWRLFATAKWAEVFNVN